MDFRQRIYNSYGQFKGWENNELSDSYYDMYQGELERHGIKAPGNILEIAFGSAHFLKWAKVQGFRVVGIEVNQDFVAKAAKENLEVYCLPLQQIQNLSASIQQFDYIVLFDILEHLYPDEILDLFERLRGLLSAQGKVLCRFPNGLSPFFTQTQWADLTHVTVLTPERLRQVGMATGFELVKYDNAYRSLKVGKRSPFIRKILYKLRSVFEYGIGLFYYGGRIPLDPNLTVSLKKI